MVAIKGCRGLILRVDDDSKGGDIGTKRSRYGVQEKYAPQALATATQVHRKAPDPSYRNCRVARQLPRYPCRKVAQSDTSHGDCVEAHDARVLAATRDKARRHITSHVLSCMLDEIPVQRVVAAIERPAVVIRSELLNTKGESHTG